MSTRHRRRHRRRATENRQACRLVQCAIVVVVECARGFVMRRQQSAL
jgi:hypothetical protein